MSVAPAASAGSRAARLAATAMPLVAALLYAAIVAGPGVPELRHDWSWPADRAGVVDLLTRSLSAWDPRGIGSPNLYINDYAISIVVAGCVLVLGSHAGLFVFTAAIAATCTFGAAALARRMGAAPWGRAAVGAIALFNPWVYAQTVAGHTYMILAFGALAGLVAECLRKSPRPLAASMLVILTLQQLQFFIFAALLAVVIAVRRRSGLPLATAAVVASPLVVSVVAELGAFSSVPYALAWTAAQSVPLAHAVALTGYFAGYTQGIDRIDVPVMFALAVLALAGFAAVARSRRAIAFVTLIAGAIVAAMGLLGPLAGVERFAMTSLPATRIFRELFDLLGFAAIGYCAGVAAAARRSTGTLAAGVAGCALAASWLVWSPWAYWVPAADIPTAAIDAQAATRFALFPAFQPLARGDGAGSGLDPDATIRAGGVDPVNTPFSSYPMDSALAAYEQRGDWKELGDLGVSLLVRRSWLRSDAGALSSQRAIPDPASSGMAGSAQDTASDPRLRIKSAPILALEPVPDVCGVCTSLDASGVFFGDVAGLRGPLFPPGWAAYPSVVGIPIRTAEVRADADWVDARLAFESDPDLGQPFGGAMTTASDAVLPVTGGLDALVFVRGRLIATSGATIARTTSGYEWASIPQDVRGVRCDGLCVVALEAANADKFPPQSSAAGRVTPIALRTLSPWLARADVPAGDASLLRYDVAYDPGWLALGAGGSPAHVRIDAVTNGWLLPPRRSAGTVTLLHWPSALAALLEIAGLAWTTAIGLLFLRSLFRRHDEAARERGA